MKIYQEPEIVPETEKEENKVPGTFLSESAKSGADRTLPRDAERTGHAAASGPGLPAILAMAAAAAALIWLPLSKSVIVRGIPLGDSFRIRLSEPNWDANQFIRKGTSMDEASYTWTDGKELVFYPLNAAQESDYLMTVQVAGIFTGSQRLAAVLNGETVYEDSLAGEREMEILLHLRQGKNDLRMELPDAVSPVELKVGNDGRKLALQLTDITFLKQ